MQAGCFFRVETYGLLTKFTSCGRQPATLAFSRSMYGYGCCTETETVAAVDDAAVAVASVQGVSVLRSSGTNDCLALLVADAGLESGEKRRKK